MPSVKGVIARRILVNYRVDPQVLQKQLPSLFRPKLHDGFGVAGICLIRLSRIRPKWAPAAIGISSENAAHRIAVEWEDVHGVREGVYIPRRDTSSCLNTLAGGRLFPGVHHLAEFSSKENDDRFEVTMRSRDGAAEVHVKGVIDQRLPADSIFQDIDDASAFFERGSLGYSATRDPTRFDGLELRTFDWEVEPLRVEEVRSSFFDDPSKFPLGSAEFDCALLMRNINHEWHGREELCCESVSV